MRYVHAQTSLGNRDYDHENGHRVLNLVRIATKKQEKSRPSDSNNRNLPPELSNVAAQDEPVAPHLIQSTHIPQFQLPTDLIVTSTRVLCDRYLPDNPVCPVSWWRSLGRRKLSLVSLSTIRRRRLRDSTVAIVSLVTRVGRRIVLWRRVVRVIVVRLLSLGLRSLLLRAIVWLRDAVARRCATQRPSGAAVRLVTHLATAASGEAGEEKEDGDGEEDYEAEDEPADPSAPGACGAVAIVAAVDIVSDDERLQKVWEGYSLVIIAVSLVDYAHVCI